MPSVLKLADEYLARYQERKRSEAAVKQSMLAITGTCDAHPKVTPAANVDDAMREQLEIAIEHASGGSCGCSLCGQYLGVRAILLAMFAETVQPLAMAAGAAG